MKPNPQLIRATAAQAVSPRPYDSPTRRELARPVCEEESEELEPEPPELELDGLGVLVESEAEPPVDAFDGSFVPQGVLLHCFCW